MQKIIFLLRSPLTSTVVISSYSDSCFTKQEQIVTISVGIHLFKEFLTCVILIQDSVCYHWPNYSHEELTYVPNTYGIGEAPELSNS